jgi:hypothetical protein
MTQKSSWIPSAPVRCNDIAPPRWKLGGKWYCSFPALRDCAEPSQLPVDPVKVSDVNLLNLGLGRSIYSKEQMEDFARFQDSQNTRKAYLAEAAELAYLGRSGGEWGLGLTELARDQIVNAVGYRLIPLYRLIGPTAVIVILVMFIVGMARMLVDILVRAIIIARVRGCFWMDGWAIEKGKEGAGRIRNQMEARAAYAPGQPQEEGPNSVEVLADWAASWRRRVYGMAPPVQATETKVGGANLPIDGGGTGSITRN